MEGPGMTASLLTENRSRRELTIAGVEDVGTCGWG